MKSIPTIKLIKQLWAQDTQEKNIDKIIEIAQNIYEYIVGEPGVYLQYYVGYLEFLELKDMAQKKYGDQFNEIAFHQALLDLGPAPFDILETYFDAYYLR